MFNWDMLVPIAGMATGLILLLPMIRAGVRYLERRSGPNPDQLAAIREELRAVHERVDALESDDARVVELEERLDFAERLLAQQRETPKLGDAD